jgi:hypothetical protein
MQDRTMLEKTIKGLRREHEEEIRRVVEEGRRQR